MNIVFTDLYQCRRDVAGDGLSSRGLVYCHLGLEQFIQLCCVVNVDSFGDRTLLGSCPQLNFRLLIITDWHF